MIWPFGKKRHLALTGDSDCALLAEITRTPSGEALSRVLARTDDPLTSDVALPRLLAAAGDVRGMVSLSLPLAFFETASVTLPAMPEAAVAKALPYHLAKAIHAPLDSFVYDWQITGRQKDRLQITVYLFPAAIFQKLRREFLRKEAQLTFFEPDIFSAFAFFLAQNKALPPEDATLCALIWQDSVSLAVHEKNRLALVRVIREQQPRDSFRSQTLEDTISTTAGQTEDLIILEEESSPSTEASPSRDADSILADFSILTAGDSPAETPAGQATTSIITPASWPEYLQHVILEIMRTRDYYSSVQKGGTIRNMVVAGASAFWPEFATQARDLLGSEPAPLGGPAGPQLLDILALGAGARW